MWFDYVPLVSIFLAIFPMVSCLKGNCSKNNLIAILLLMGTAGIDLFGIQLAITGQNNLWVGKAAAMWGVAFMSLFLYEDNPRKALVPSVIMALAIMVSYLIEDQSFFGLIVRPMRSIIFLWMSVNILWDKRLEKFSILSRKTSVPLMLIPVGIMGLFFGSGNVLLLVSRHQAEILWSIKIGLDIMLAIAVAISCSRGSEYVPSSP